MRIFNFKNFRFLDVSYFCESQWNPFELNWYLDFLDFQPTLMLGVARAVVWGVFSHSPPLYCSFYKLSQTNENNGQLRFCPPPWVVHASRLDQFTVENFYVQFRNRWPKTVKLKSKFCWCIFTCSLLSLLATGSIETKTWFGSKLNIILFLFLYRLVHYFWW